MHLGQFVFIFAYFKYGIIEINLFQSKFRAWEIHLFLHYTFYFNFGCIFRKN